MPPRHVRRRIKLLFLVSHHCEEIVDDYLVFGKDEGCLFSQVHSVLYIRSAGVKEPLVVIPLCKILLFHSVREFFLYS